MLTETNARQNKAIPIGNLDFYICPKNATNTIRYCQYIFNGGTKQIPDFRNEVTSKGAGLGYSLLHLVKGKVEYNIERADSIKVAVVRDPLDRFVSALQWINYKHNLDLTLEEASINVPKDVHFYTQTYFYGSDPTKFDHIISPNEITTLIKNITGKDLGSVHKGRNPNPELYEITKDISNRITTYYRDDFNNGYC